MLVLGDARRAKELAAYGKVALVILTVVNRSVALDFQNSGFHMDVELVVQNCVATLHFAGAVLTHSTDAPLSTASVSRSITHKVE